MKKTLLAVSALVVIGGIAGPAAAQPNLPKPEVSVTTDNGGVQVGTGITGQPLLGVSADDNGICAGFSYQMGHCVPSTIK